MPIRGNRRRLGTLARARPARAGPLPTLPLVLGEITVVGNLIGTHPDLADLVTLAGQGKVVLHSTRYPLEAANDAINDLRHGRIHGRAILTPSRVGHS